MEAEISRHKMGGQKIIMHNNGKPMSSVEFVEFAERARKIAEEKNTLENVNNKSNGREI